MSDDHELMTTILDWFMEIEQWIPGAHSMVGEIILGPIPLSDANNVYDLADQWGRLASALNDAYEDVLRAANPILENWSGDEAASLFAQQWFAYLEGLRQTAESAGQMQRGVQSFGLEVELMKFMALLNLIMLAVSLFMLIAAAIPSGGGSLSAAPGLFMGTRIAIGQLASKTVGRIASIVMRLVMRSLTRLFGKLPAAVLRRALPAGVRAALPRLTSIVTGRVAGAMTTAMTRTAVGRAARAVAARGIAKAVANRMAAQALRGVAGRAVYGTLASQTRRAVERQLAQEIRKQLLRQWTGKAVTAGTNKVLTKLAEQQVARSLGRELASYVGTRVAFGAGFMGGGNLLGQFGQVLSGNRTEGIDWGQVGSSTLQGAAFGAGMFGGPLGHAIGGAAAGGGVALGQELYDYATTGDKVDWGTVGHGALQGGALGVVFGGQTHLENAHLGAGKLRIGEDVHVLSGENGRFNIASARAKHNESLLLTSDGYAAWHGKNDSGVVPDTIAGRPDATSAMDQHWPGRTAEPPAAQTAPAAAPAGSARADVPVARADPGTPVRAGDDGGGGGGGGGGPRQHVPSGGDTAGRVAEPVRPAEARPPTIERVRVSGGDGASIGDHAGPPDHAAHDADGPTRPDLAAHDADGPTRPDLAAHDADGPTRPDHAAHDAGPTTQRSGDGPPPPPDPEVARLDETTGGHDHSTHLASAGHDTGVDPDVTGAIEQGTVRFREHPDFPRIEQDLLDLGVTFHESQKPFPYVEYRHVYDSTGHNLLRTEREMHVVKDMRFLDFEHEVGHVRQLESRERFPDGPPASEAKREMPDGSLKKVNGKPTIGARMYIVEYHVRLEEVIRLIERRVDRPIIDAHLEGLDAYATQYRDGVQRKPLGGHAAWAREHFPDIPALRQRIEDLRTTLGNGEDAPYAAEGPALERFRARFEGRDSVGEVPGRGGVRPAAAEVDPGGRADADGGGIGGHDTAGGGDRRVGHDGGHRPGPAAGRPPRPGEPGHLPGERDAPDAGDGSGRPVAGSHVALAGERDVRGVDPYRLVPVDGPVPEHPVAAPHEVAAVLEREVSALVDGRQPGAPDRPYQADPDPDPQSRTLRLRYGDGVEVDVVVQVNESVPPGRSVVVRPSMEAVDGGWRQTSPAGVVLSPHVPADPAARTVHVQQALDGAWRALHREVGDQLGPPPGRADGVPPDALRGLEEPVRADLPVRDADVVGRYRTTPADPPAPTPLTPDSVRQTLTGRGVPEQLTRWAGEHLTTQAENGTPRPKSADEITATVRALADEAVDLVTPRSEPVAEPVDPGRDGASGAHDMSQGGGAVRPRDLLDVERQDRWAAQAYDRFRADPADVADIARNLDGTVRPDGSVGFTEAEIARVKYHLFENDTHRLNVYDDEGNVVGYREGSFDPDADIAEAWIRLRAGRRLPADLVLLEHELAESNHMRENPGAKYADAHAAANRRFPWERQIPERTGEDLDGWRGQGGDTAAVPEGQGDGAGGGVPLRGPGDGPPPDHRQGGAHIQSGGRSGGLRDPGSAARDLEPGHDGGQLAGRGRRAALSGGRPDPVEHPVATLPTGELKILGFDDRPGRPGHTDLLERLSRGLGAHGDGVALRRPDVPAADLGPGARVLGADRLPGITGRISPLLRLDGLPSDADVLVGHGDTAGVADRLRRYAYPDAKLVQVVDRIPVDGAGRPDPRWVELLGRADLVVATPGVASRVAGLVAGMADPPAVHELPPVFEAGPDLVRAPGEGGFHVLVHGNDLAGYRDAAAAVGELRARGLDDVRLTVTAHKMKPDQVRAIQLDLTRIAGGPVEVRVLVDDGPSLVDHVRDADLVIVGSGRDGLLPPELVAAVEHGVPVLVDGRGGAAALLGDPGRVLPDAGRVLPDADGRIDAGGRFDVRGWADRVQLAHADPAAERGDMLRLRDELTAGYRLDPAARGLHDAISGLGSGVARVGDAAWRTELSVRDVVLGHAAEVARPADGRPVVLTTCTEYWSNKGGIPSANRDLTESFGTQGSDTHALVSTVDFAHPERLTGEGGEGEHKVRVVGAEQVWGVLDHKGGPDTRALFMLPEGLPKEVDLVVGHSRFSGGGARWLVDHVYPDAKYLHVLHTSPEVLDALKGDSDGPRHAQTERELMARADLVAGVGPLLAAEAARLAHEAAPDHPPPVHAIIPDLRPWGPEPGPRPADRTGYDLLIQGRADDVIKGVKLGARLAAELHAQGKEIRLTVRGAPKGEAGHQEAELRALVGDPPGLTIKVLEFSQDRNELLRDVQNADLVLMPSIHEGFGLVATDAVRAGKPVLAGEGAGAAWFLGDRHFVPPDLGEAMVVRDGNTLDSLRHELAAITRQDGSIDEASLAALRQDIDNRRLGPWLERAHQVLTHPDPAGAVKLRQYLAERYGPGNAAREVLHQLGLLRSPGAVSAALHDEGSAALHDEGSATPRGGEGVKLSSRSGTSGPRPAPR